MAHCGCKKMAYCGYRSSETSNSVYLEGRRFVTCRHFAGVYAETLTFETDRLNDIRPAARRAENGFTWDTMVRHLGRRHDWRILCTTRDFGNSCLIHFHQLGGNYRSNRRLIHFHQLRRNRRGKRSRDNERLCSNWRNVILNYLRSTGRCQ